MEKINFHELDKNGNHLIRLVGADQEHRVNLMKASEDLYEACELVDRAWAGDGVDMATAVDACLLAIAKVEQRPEC